MVQNEVTTLGNPEIDLVLKPKNAVEIQDDELKEIDRLGKPLTREKLKEVCGCSCGPQGEHGLSGAVFC